MRRMIGWCGFVLLGLFAVPAMGAQQSPGSQEDVVLPTVVVVPLENGQMERHMREYEALQRGGSAEYISRKTLSKYDRQSLGEALRILRRGCDNVSLNGEPIVDVRDALRTRWRLTSKVDGVELYHAPIPAVFTEKGHAPLDCIMVVWLRIPPPGE